jgi:hypothetical protein
MDDGTSQHSAPDVSLPRRLSELLFHRCPLAISFGTRGRVFLRSTRA